MKIVVDYESSWRNSFLGGSNNEPLPKKGRDFVASMRGLKEIENYIPRKVTKDTVLGLLNRLIGDQRKLYQARNGFAGHPFYFEDIERRISFKDEPSILSQEVCYIRNINGSTDQKSFTGMIHINAPIFQSEYSSLLWGVLWLDSEELFDFILENKNKQTEVVLDPLGIIRRLEEIKKIKLAEETDKARSAAAYLQENFDKYKPINGKGHIVMLSMYCSALYLQLQRLEKIYDMESAKSKRGGISGISHNGFTPRDFMDKYTTGSKKLIYGSPYVRVEFVKGEGKIGHLLTKASGRLIISLDIDLDRAKNLKRLIDNAGVSTFYLGKKGLAYVSHIDVR